MTLRLNHVALLPLGLVLLLGFAFGAGADDMDNRLVLQVQQELDKRGFDPGPHDGIMGPRTRQAVIAFQAEMGLETSGRLNGPTLNKLGLKVRSDDDGVLGEIGDGLAIAGKAVLGASKKAAKATAKGATVAAHKTAQASKTGAKATAKGATVAAEATADAAETGAEATAKGATVAAKETADAVETGAQATAEGMTVAAKTTAKATTKAAKSTANALKTAADETTDFLFGEDDPGLAERVEKRLQAHPRVDSDRIEVIVEGPGTVRLVFKDGSQQDWERAVALTRRVEGVDKVFVRLPKTTG